MISDYLLSYNLIVLREEAIKKAELLFQALDADGDGSLTQVRSLLITQVTQVRS